VTIYEVSMMEDGSSDPIDDTPAEGSERPTASSSHEDESDEHAVAAQGPPGLAQTLLHQPVAADDRPNRRWCYPAWLQIIATLFILYHGVILLVHNLPGKGLAKGAQKVLNDKLDANTYWQASGNTQSWAMFAPNPHRSNIFMKVMVKDKDGEVWDLKHDIYGKRQYPYLWYDRMGKINRRLIDQKGYRRHYAAWVCREWEKDHEGEAAEEVQFVKMWTQIPPPQAVFERAEGNLFKMGFDPMDLSLKQREEDIISCATNRQAQLPDYLRERYGLPPAPERHYKELSVRTWWDQRESERLKEEREQRLGKKADAKPGEDEGDGEDRSGEGEGDDGGGE
jgi:hypothetical protein